MSDFEYFYPENGGVGRLCCFVTGQTTYRLLGHVTSKKTGESVVEMFGEGYARCFHKPANNEPLKTIPAVGAWCVEIVSSNEQAITDLYNAVFHHGIISPEIIKSVRAKHSPSRATLTSVKQVLTLVVG